MFMGFLVAGFVILLVVVFWLIASYNGLVRSKNFAENGWAQIDVQLKRRHDLIPNLVESVKGAMNFEKETLEKVIQARNQAIGSATPSEKGQAEAKLTSALSGFFGLVESYPDLKATTNIGQLQEELAATEGKITMARQYYNDTVTDYNTKLQVFPSSLVAQFGSFQRKELFELENPAEREPVKVQF